jgi:hypothetical protein
VFRNARDLLSIRSAHTTRMSARNAHETWVATRKTRVAARNARETWVAARNAHKTREQL